MLKRTRRLSRQHGTTMMEVLVTLLILALGMLGLAGLQSRMQLAEMEAYQRAQAVVLLSDMTDRIYINAAGAESYVTGTATPLGTANTTACIVLATLADRDLCQWSDALKGAAETKGGASVGAMIGARGCIERLQAPDASPTVCQPGKYRVSVTWQGLNPTAAPSLTCGAGSYGSANLQRLITTNVTIGLPKCF